MSGEPCSSTSPERSRPSGVFADAAHARRSQLTFRFDRIRGTCAGILETGTYTFALVIAIRWFDAPQSLKALVSSATSMGLLLTPLSLFLYARARWNAARAASANFFGGAAMLALAAAAQELWQFVGAMVIGSMMLAQQAPLLVHIYTANYAPDRRGRMLSTSIVLSLVTAMGFSLIGGHVLDREIGAFRILMLVMCAAALVAGWAVGRMPAEPFAAERGSNPLSAMRFAWQDKVFGSMLVVWMLMGFGNLLMLPLRVEYLANPQFGIDATNTQIALVTAVVPSVVRLATTHVWGSFFDRYDFFVIRTVLNGFFLVAILVFFSTRSLWVIGVAGALIGMAMAGSNIAWNLWVTKFAPPGRASDYMSVHTFLTGVRGVLAPFVGFWLIVRISPMATAWIGAGLIALSMVLLDPLRRRHKSGRAGAHPPAAGLG